MTKPARTRIGCTSTAIRPQRYASHDPRPDLPFHEPAPEAWPYLFEAVLWTALLLLGVWGLLEIWR